MKLSIIIISYNTRGVITECLRSIDTYYKPAISKKEFEVIVVDNGSEDDSIAHIKKYFPWVRLIESNKNFGFGAANNRAIKKTTGEYVLFLNPDTKLDKTSLPTVMAQLDQDPQTAIATAKVTLPHGVIDDASHRGFPTPWRAITHFLGLSKLVPHSMLLNGYHLGYQKMDKVHEIDACAGAYLMIRRKIGELVGWFDEDYFWYGEDLDLCYRVKLLNYKVMFVPSATVFHYKGAASGMKKHSQHLAKINEETRQKIKASRFEVMRIFYNKHYKNKYPEWLTGLVFLGIGIKQRLTK